MQRTRFSNTLGFAAGLLSLACLIHPALPARGEQAAATELFVRDAWTGLAVPGVEVQVGTDSAAPSPGDASGHLRFAASLDGQQLEIRAPGYRAMSVARFQHDLASAVTAVWLMPRERAPELQPEWIATHKLPATTLLHGHVVDPDSGQPIPAATVTLAGSEKQVAANARGYFLLYTHGTRVLSPADVPEFADLVVSAPGRVSVRLAHIALFEDDFHFIVDLPRGQGETFRDMSHKLYPLGFEAGEPRLEGRTEDHEFELGEEAAASTQAAPALAELLGPNAVTATAGGLQLVNPPDQINVSGFGLVPLEVYLARGLCAEWISSWGANSLASGAIAYRSYGSWYQINQGSICTTTSCQVYNNTYNANCDAAAQKTTGILLQRSGAVARSEYSAENNSLRCSSFSCVNTDLSCGSGKAGSPAASWPCLSDSHLFDQGPGTCCFGHGRGMCQWGTQAWSRGGQLWNWITDHYFNANGSGTGMRTMFMTSPFTLVSATFPASVTRGTTITVNETLRSYTDWNQGQILLGASLLGPSSISDPAHDKKVTVLARTSFSVQSRDTAVSRLFTVPATATRGTYDLLVAIWFDTNGNNTIDSNDKPLRTLSYPAAVVVN